MTTQHMLELAKQIQENSAAKGFWNEGDRRSKGEMVMLMVSELGECLEAHRIHNFFYPNMCRFNFDAWEKWPDDNAWNTDFENYVKNTVQDEMADVVIRVLDYLYGWNLPYITHEYCKQSTGNFGHDLLRINWYILEAYHATENTREAQQKVRMTGTLGRDWGYVIAAIEAFCQWYAIDIWQHVKWKMKYNSTREKMHGKAY